MRDQHEKARRRPIALACALMALTAAVVSAQNTPFPDVTAISLEDLMNLKVTSVSKREQKLADAPAAIFVITQEDIRRSGALNIPEALRMVPGVEVARIDENKWAITSRGFNSRFANKLLVLIDGRSVYTPLFSGVFWNVQDTLLEDVDRIEVIRGPGATLWGANAVNGVINIITKEADATQKGLITAQTGNELNGQMGVRYGGKAGKNTYYRAYTKYSNFDSSLDEMGRNAFDGWNATRGGFHIDNNATPDDSFTIQGDLYQTGYGETLSASLLTPPYRTTFRNHGNFSGGNMLGRWNHAFSRSKTSLQLYYDKTNMGANNLLVDHQNIYDLDFQHDIRIQEGNELIWGVGFRHTQDKIYPSKAVTLNPDHRGFSLFSAFTQDEFALFRQRLRVTVGSKFEHNEFTGFEMEPNARFLWMMSGKQSVWGAISRAVRTPARSEEDVRLLGDVMPPSPATLGLPLQTAIWGSHAFDSENLIAYEGGYRVQLGARLSADIATFYDSYSDLQSAEPQNPFLALDPMPVHLVLPIIPGNKRSGATHGMELFTEWKGAAKWKLSGSYSFLSINTHTNAGSLDSSNPDGSSPRHQYYVRSSFDPTKQLEQDVTLRYVHSLDGLAIPSYYSLDARIGWKAASNLDFSITGKNLTNNRHVEFSSDFIGTSPTQVKRTFHAGLTWRF